MVENREERAIKHLEDCARNPDASGRLTTVFVSALDTVLSALATRTKALEPFSLADNLDRSLADDIRITIMRGMITANDFRFARKALGEKK